MAYAKISQWLSRAFERRQDNTSPAGTGTRSISAPFNVKILPQDEGMTSPSRDNPDQDVSKLRHTAGPGFQFVSDLHCERQLDSTTHQYAVPDIPKRAPYLILAGDIGRLCDRGALKCMLRQLCSTFERVLLVPGNHEFYGTSRQERLRIGEELSTELGDNFVLMNRRRVDLGDAVVLGCTLHSHIPEGSHLTNDFIRIQSWSVEDHNDEHHRDLSWLEKILSEVAASRPDVRVIIVTHYAPTYQKTCHPKHEKSIHRHCFCSATLQKFRDWKGANQVTHWVYGHTHYNTVFTFDSTVVVSNQPDDRDCLRKFDPEATI